MAASESQGPTSLCGTPNFYRVTFFLSFILLLLLPFGILASDIWLKSREMYLDARVTALETEIESLSEEMGTRRDGIPALQNEQAEIVRSAQAFVEDANQVSPWTPDTRWSVVAQARLQEIWGQLAAIEDRLAQSRALVREKNADLTLARVAKDRNTYFRTLIKDRKIGLYAAILVGAFGTALSSLFWLALVQARVNAILGRWAR